MRRFLLFAIALFVCYVLSADEYVDHRGHPVDSLERVVAAWTPQMIDSASEEELKSLVRNWIELMQGNLQINPVKSDYYAGRILEVACPRGWFNAQYDAYKILGQGFWARDQYDSAAVYFKHALDAVSCIEEGKASDDLKSSLYGAIGNLYSIQDSIDLAMEYYGKAGEIFRKYGWLNSCSVLYYNMGETWLDAGEQDKAEECYEESLRFALEAKDSLWIASAYKGLGSLYLAQGKTTRALRSLRRADQYFSIHEDEELNSRLETVDCIGQVLDLQKRRLRLDLLALLLIVLLAGSVAFVALRLKKSETEKAEVSELLEETISEIPAVPDVKLNDRELAILRMLAEGKETAEMAEALFLSAETIKWYRKRLLVKFDVTTAPALVSEAYKKGILQ